MNISLLKKQLVVPVAAAILCALIYLLLRAAQAAVLAKSGYNLEQHDSLRTIETLTLIAVCLCAIIIFVRLLNLVIFDLALRKFYRPAKIDRSIFSVVAYLILLVFVVRYLFPNFNLGALLSTSLIFLLLLLVGIPLYIFTLNKNVAATTNRPGFIRLLIAPLIGTVVFAVAFYAVQTTASPYFGEEGERTYLIYRWAFVLTGGALGVCVALLFVRTLNESVFLDYRIRKGHRASVLNRNVFSAIAYLLSMLVIGRWMFPPINFSFLIVSLPVVLICIAAYAFVRFSGSNVEISSSSSGKRRATSLIALVALIITLAAAYFLNPWLESYFADMPRVRLLLTLIKAASWIGVSVLLMQLASRPVFNFIFRLFNGDEPSNLSYDIFLIIAQLTIIATIYAVLFSSESFFYLITTVVIAGVWKTRKQLGEWLDRGGSVALGPSQTEPEKELAHESIRAAEHAATEVSISAVSPNSRDSSARLRHAIENKFPHLIARSFYQLRGVDDWQAEIPQMANVLGITLEHLAIIALSEYLSGNARDAELNRHLLEKLKKPVSHGAWAGVLRETLVFLRDQPEEMLTRGLSESYFPTQGEKSVGALKEMGDELVQLRNDLLKRTAGARPAREKQQRFKRQLIKFLQAAAFLKDYPLVSVKSTKTQAGIKSHLCYLQVGFHDSFEQASVQCDLDLESTRVIMLNPQASEVLYLYPFYTTRECPECSSLHLFRFDQMDKGRVEYVATEGHRFRDAEAGADLMTLLEKPSSILLRQTAKYLCLEATEEWHQLSIGQQIDGKYEIVKHLRRGGMADVYKVKDLESQTCLALKLLPFQFLSDRTMLQRFRQEATRARSLDHPNITCVFDYGEDLVDHYLVMELAEGWSAAEGTVALDVGELHKPLDEARVLSIIKQACEGLDYIHQQQIVHRDVKPGNLLLFGEERIKLADFGIARSRESITLTMTGLAMGTPEYMSPEQAEGKKNLTHASDIYSLGVVMYELLTGETPFRRTTPLATAVAHLREPVPPLSGLNPNVSDELQRIVLRCLEKEPQQRFESARALFQAIDSYERSDKAVRVSTPQRAVRGMARTLTGHDGSVNTLAFSPDGRTLASGGADTTVRLWDVQNGTLKLTIKAHEVEVTSVAYSPDGAMLMSGSFDKTVRLWDPRTGEAKRTLIWYRNPAVDVVAFSPDGRLGASGGEMRDGGTDEIERVDRSGEINLWDAQALRLKRMLTGHSFTVTSIAFSPDSKTLASSSWDKTIRLWDVETGESKLIINEHSGAVYAVAISPDGKTLASASEDQTLKLWDVATGELTQTLTGHSSRVLTVAFSKDGATLASGSGEHQKWGEVKLWETRTNRLKQTLRGHSGAVLSVAFSHDGETLGSASSDGSLRLWDLRELGSQSPKILLWVDDQPENNSSVVTQLRKEGVKVIEALSTTEAMSILIASQQKIDVVVSDMGRTEEGEYRAKAGLILIRAARRSGLEIPIYVYCSERYIVNNHEEVLTAGGNGATASFSELLELIMASASSNQG